MSDTARVRDSLVRWFQREGVTVEETEGVKPFVNLGVFERAGERRQQFMFEAKVSLYDLAVAIVDGRIG